MSGRNFENPRSPIFTSKSTERKSTLDKKYYISSEVKEIMSAVVNSVPSTVTGDLKLIRMFDGLMSRCMIPALCRSSIPRTILVKIKRASYSLR